LQGVVDGVLREEKVGRRLQRFFVEFAEFAPAPVDPIFVDVVLQKITLIELLGPRQQVERLARLASFQQLLSLPAAALEFQYIHLDIAGIAKAVAVDQSREQNLGAQIAAQGRHVGGQIVASFLRVGAGPEDIDHFVTGYHPVRVGQEILQQLQGQRPDRTDVIEVFAFHGDAQRPQTGYLQAASRLGELQRLLGRFANLIVAIATVEIAQEPAQMLFGSAAQILDGHFADGRVAVLQQFLHRLGPAAAEPGQQLLGGLYFHPVGQRRHQ